MKHLLACILFPCVALLAQAQEITIDLPHFAGKEYVWLINNGDNAEAVASGVLDSKGKAVLTVPSAYKNWRGMSNFILKEGGGLQLILNGEKAFTAGCIIEMPTVSDIFYTCSDENNFLLGRYLQQQRLLNKASAITAAVQEYTPQEPLYDVLSKEKASLEKQYVEMQIQTAKSPLYAARIRQMTDFLNALGSRLDMTEEELMEEQRRYVREDLDFEKLWNSGLWKNTFTRWISLVTAESDSILLADSKAILVREQGKGMRDTLLKKMISLFYQYGKENLLTDLGIEDMLSPGHQAPELSLPDGTRFVPLNSLVIFYESGCGSCENELLQLIDNYTDLKEKNIRVISVSADTNEEIFMKNTGTFPWQQKLCDYEGFEGVNFKNYAVIGTPTIYSIDEKGMITGRYARFVDWIKN